MSGKALLVAMLLLVLVGFGLSGPRGQAAVKSALFFLQVLPNVPVRPLAWLTPEPIQERVAFPYRDGLAEAEPKRLAPQDSPQPQLTNRP